MLGSSGIHVRRSIAISRDSQYPAGRSQGSVSRIFGQKESMGGKVETTVVKLDLLSQSQSSSFKTPSTSKSTMYDDLTPPEPTALKSLSSYTVLIGEDPYGGGDVDLKDYPDSVHPSESGYFAQSDSQYLTIERTDSKHGSYGDSRYLPGSPFTETYISQPLPNPDMRAALLRDSSNFSTMMRTPTMSMDLLRTPAASFEILKTPSASLDLGMSDLESLQDDAGETRTITKGDYEGGVIQGNESEVVLPRVSSSTAPAADDSLPPALPPRAQTTAEEDSQQTSGSYLGEVPSTSSRPSSPPPLDATPNFDQDILSTSRDTSSSMATFDENHAMDGWGHAL
ncbi:hypothetical protein K474DRAFT_184376 [Panus rudis PR-1116 ss-1]|nr:hypothetical protein K474DRAFT_184376 [Panus rudis PR-1116 ss-1]